jgi:hypothetical protein
MGKLEVAAEKNLDNFGASADQKEFHIQAVFLVELFIFLHPNRKVMAGGAGVTRPQFGLSYGCARHDLQARGESKKEYRIAGVFHRRNSLAVSRNRE